jgi:hypothetical protein
VPEPEPEPEEETTPTPSTAAAATEFVYGPGAIGGTVTQAALGFTAFAVMFLDWYYKKSATAFFNANTI